MRGLINFVKCMKTTCSNLSALSSHHSLEEFGVDGDAGSDVECHVFKQLAAGRFGALHRIGEAKVPFLFVDLVAQDVVFLRCDQCDSVNDDLSA